MRAAEDPIGPENDHWLRRIASEVDFVVVAWATTPRISVEASNCGDSSVAFSYTTSV